MGLLGLARSLAHHRASPRITHAVAVDAAQFCLREGDTRWMSLSGARVCPATGLPSCDPGRGSAQVTVSVGCLFAG